MTELESDGCSLALSHTESPIYGGGTLVIAFSEDTLIPGDAEIVLVYQGSKQRHTTSTTFIREINTIQTTIPGHDKEEEVDLTVHVHTSTGHNILATRKFQYKFDSAYHIAKFLLESVEQDSALDDLELIKSDKFDLSNEVPSTLDERLSAAFAHQDIPEYWNILGSSYNEDQEPEPRETVLHFAAHLGLTKLATILLDKPGGDIAVQLPNKEGDLPKDIARNFGMDGLAELLSEYNTHTVMTEVQITTKVQTKTAVIHRYPEGTASVSSVITDNSNRTIDEDIAMLKEMSFSQSELPVKKQKQQTVSWGDENPHSVDDIILEHGSDEESEGQDEKDEDIMDADAICTSPTKAEERKHILAANIQKLHDISEDIQRLKESNVICNANNVNERRGSLARFSSSCPTLDNRLSPPLDQKPEFFKSMMHLPVPEEYSDEEEEYLETESDQCPPDSSGIRIHLNDVTMHESSTDYTFTPETKSPLRMGLRHKVHDRNLYEDRRRSWHIESSQGDSQTGFKQSRHLAVAGKCFSLSSLDSTEEVLEDDSYGDIKSSTGSQLELKHVGAGADSRHSPTLSLANSSLCQEPTARSTPTDSNNSPNCRPDTAASIRSMSDIDLELDSSNDSEMLDQNTTLSPSSVKSQPLLRHMQMTKSISTPQISRNRENNKENALLHSADQIKSRSQAGQVTYRQHQALPEELKHPTNFENDDDRLKHGLKDVKGKRRTSMFSKLQGSMRQKRNKDKDHKHRTSHSYMSVSFSNSRLCDACGKSMANKPALQCENCTVSVHESSCKDQIAACTKFKHPKLAQRPVSLARAPQSFKVNPQGSSTLSGQAGAIPSKAISEMDETDHEKLDLATSHNIAEAYSVSTESLDEITVEVEFEDDPDLVLKGPEIEAWSVSIDKKTMKLLKLSSKDIKRQDHIWELIQTEKHYYRILKVMQKIFAYGMVQELQMTQDTVDRIFPQLDELLDMHQTFLNKLRDRQEKRTDKYIELISDILIEQCGGNMGDRMKKAYGDFCSRHKEAVSFYKDLLKNDRKFQNFIKKCSMNSLCKRMGVTECILFVTQRLTKYPPLIEAIVKPMKDTKDSKSEKDNLKTAVGLAQDILKHVDEQIDARNREMRLLEIYNRLDARSSAKFRKRDFKKSDLLAKTRKLMKEGTIGFKTARGKEVEVLMILLTDVVLFLEDNNQKLSFLSLDKKSGAVPLFKLIARENGARRDKRSMFLITQLQDAYDMFEIVCKSKFECDDWIRTFKDATMKCPDEEDEGVPSESEEERKMAEARFAKLHELTGHLRQKDDDLLQCCNARFHVIKEMLELHGYDDVLKGLKTIYPSEDVGDVWDHRELLQAVVHEASRLSWLIQSNAQVHLDRSTSSVGEQESGLATAPSLPKRAETFAGFDNITNGYGKKHNLPDGPEQDGRSTSLQNLRHDSETDSIHSPDALEKIKEHARLSRRPSFLHQLIMGKEEPESKTSDKFSDRGSLMEFSSASSLQSLGPPSQDQASSLLQLTKHLHDLVMFANRQSSQVESLRVQLAQSLDRAERFKQSQLERRGTFRHNHQLEELRNLQEEVSRERKHWEKEKLREKQRLDAETSEVELRQKEIEKEMEDLRSQKEELLRQRQAFQRQIDFFQESMASQKQQPSYSTPLKDTDHCSTDGVDGTSAHKKSHQRSASDDLSKTIDGDPFEPMDPKYSSSLNEPLNRDIIELNQRPFSTGSAGSLTDVSVTSPPSGGKRHESRADNSNLPEHLYSATNEVKGSLVQQKIPVKLSSLASGSNIKATGSTKKDKSTSNINSSSMNNNSSTQDSPSSRSLGSKASKSTGNILPLKLAESSGKRKPDSPASHKHAPSPIHVSDSIKDSPKGQRRELSPSKELKSPKKPKDQQEVIYF